MSIRILDLKSPNEEAGSSDKQRCPPELVPGSRGSPGKNSLFAEAASSTDSYSPSLERVLLSLFSAPSDHENGQFLGFSWFRCFR